MSIPTASHSKTRRFWFYLTNAIVVAVIFAIDSYLVVDVNFGIPYLVWIVLTYFGDWPEFSLIAGVLSSLLVYFGAALSPPGHIPFGIIVVNRGLTIFAIWVCTVFIWKTKRSDIAKKEELGIQTCRGELTERTREQLSPREVAQKILDFLADVIGVHLGAFYRIGSDTYQAMAYVGGSVSTQLDPSKSLVGSLMAQSVSKRSVLIARDIPKNYVSAHSGLGSSDPKELLLCPVVALGKVIGVIELGTFQGFQPGHIKLLDRISDIIANRIELAEANEASTILLRKTEEQHLELQRRHEELGRLNENLRAQAQELEVQQEALEQSNQQLQDQRESLVERQDKLEQVNEELQRARHEVEKNVQGLWIASKYKSEFLATMSHELRTPLNSILILAKLLTDGLESSGDLEKLEFATTIQSSATELLHLINDILDLSKVEAGKLELEPNQVPLKELSDRLARQFSPQAKIKKLQFNVEWDPNCPIIIVTDSHRLEQILRNFLGNAIKFTDTGSVTLKFDAPPEPRSALYYVAIRVSDTGIGIPKDKQGIIFEPFRQVDTGIRRRYEGTGLGLAIARELAKLLGGDIEVESEEGKGSTFTLYLPHAIEPHQVTPSSSHPAFKPSKVSSPVTRTRAPRGTEFGDDRNKITPSERVVIVIEDDPVFSQLLYDACTERGFRCLRAETGEEGLLDIAEYHPSAILIDLHLPGISGIAVLDRLKHQPETRHIPVHAFSIEDHAQQVLKMGAIGFLQKPLNKDDLEVALKRIERQIHKSTDQILVVSGDPTERDEIYELLANENLKITHVDSIKEVQSALPGSSFDCVIVCLRLRDGNGFELIDKLQRSSEEIPPIILCATRELTQDERERLHPYSKTVVIKEAPSREHLLDEVTLFLHRVEASLPEDKREMLEQVRHREPIFQGKKVLLVDDDMRNVFALRKILSRKGLEVIAGKNGKEGWELLKAHPDTRAVLFDIMMPVMDGFEFVRTVRSDRKYSKLPLIAVTAKAMKGDREDCLEAGASDYLAKPIDIDKLLSVLRLWLTT